MNWITVVEVFGGGLLLNFAILRVDRQRWWMVAVFFELPVLVLVIMWASLYELWPEVLIGGALASAVAGGWWISYGRKLPPPSSDNIKVWGQDDAAAPKPKPAQLQSEIDRLRADNEQLEAELRRLKSGPNGSQNN